MGLDAVELILAFEESFDIEISDRDAQKLETPRQVIDYICDQVPLSSADSICLSQRTFHKIRADLIETSQVHRKKIRPDTKICDIFPKEHRKQQWNDFRKRSSMVLPALNFGRGTLFQPITVNDLVHSAYVDAIPNLLKKKQWTRNEVREIVRHLISYQLGVNDFSDDDNFISDLGAD